MTSGTSSIRSAIENQGLGDHYAVGGRGTESLATQWIIDHPKPGGQALVVAPFDDLRTWLVDRLWTHEEKVALGIAEEVFEVDNYTMMKMIDDAGAALDALRKALK